MSLTLQSGEGAEIKAAMKPGERLVFSWTATGGGVDVDMHSEFLGAAPASRPATGRTSSRPAATAHSRRRPPAITAGSGRT